MASFSRPSVKQENQQAISFFPEFIIICNKKENERLCTPVFLDVAKIFGRTFPSAPVERACWLGIGETEEFPLLTDWCPLIVKSNEYVLKKKTQRLNREYQGLLCKRCQFLTTRRNLETRCDNVLLPAF